MDILVIVMLIACTWLWMRRVDRDNHDVDR